MHKRFTGKLWNRRWRLALISVRSFVVNVCLMTSLRTENTGILKVYPSRLPTIKRQAFPFPLVLRRNKIKFTQQVIEGQLLCNFPQAWIKSNGDPVLGSLNMFHLPYRRICQFKLTAAVTCKPLTIPSVLLSIKLFPWMWWQSKPSMNE